MKRRHLSVLVVTAALILASCSNDDDKPKTTTTVPTSTTLSSTSSTAAGGSTTTAAPAFAPNAVSGLQVWLRADTGVTASSGKVSLWEDQSGSGLHAAQPQGTRQPSLAPTDLNGKPALRFDGVDDGLAIPFDLSPAKNASVTVFAVWSSEPVGRGASLRKLYGHDDDGFDRTAGFDDRASTQWGYFAGDGGVKLYFSPTAGTATLTTDVWTPTTFSGFVNSRVKVNNQPVNNTAGNATMALGSIRHDTKYPGDRNQTRYGGYEPWHGTIAEFLIYDRPLTQDERQQVERHLIAKYGIIDPAS